MYTQSVAVVLWILGTGRKAGEAEQWQAVEWGSRAEAEIRLAAPIPLKETERQPRETPVWQLCRCTLNKAGRWEWINTKKGQREKYKKYTENYRQGIKGRQNSVFSDVKQYSATNVNWRFRGVYRLHLQDYKVNLTRNKQEASSKQSWIIDWEEECMKEIKAETERSKVTQARENKK
jgi:hypothetical protein